MMTKKEQNEQQNFYCEKCDYLCSSKYNFDRHQFTRKHQNDDAELQKTSKKSKPIPKMFNCECGNEYSYRQGLWNHKKICVETDSEIKITYDIDSSSNEIKMLTNLILNVVKQNHELINQNNEAQKQNQELQKGVLDIIKNGTNTITNNSHNKTFNLQVFLNETCKDAMNIMDFADSIQLKLTDLENVGEYGFVDGISKIIIKSLQEMDVNLRPVHCSDLKREVAYVRENGKWEKDTPDNKLIKKAIKRVAHRNIRQIPEWKKLYPDCGLSDSNKSDQYNELTIEAMGGRGNDDDAKASKIVKKIMKNVVINKDY
jgi:hypothetical protein